MLERRNRALLLKMTAFLVAPSRHRAHLGVQRLCPARHAPAASVHIAAARSSGPEEIDEVITRIERRAAAKQLRRFLAEDPTRHFQNVDTDGSGEISFEEWEQGFGQDSRFQPHLRALFNELDVDMNGSVSYSEFIRVIEADLIYGTPWERRTKTLARSLHESMTETSFTWASKIQEGTPVGNFARAYKDLSQYMKAVDFHAVIAKLFS